MKILIFNTESLPAARAAFTNNTLAWFIAPSGAVHDVLPADLALDPFVSSRPAIFPDLEQALATMPVEDPELVWLISDSTRESLSGR